MWKKGDIVVWNPTYAHLIPKVFVEQFPGPFLVTELRADEPGKYKYTKIRDAVGGLPSYLGAFPEYSKLVAGWHEDWFSKADPFIAAVWRRRHGA